MNITLGVTGMLPWFKDRMFSASMVARGKPFPDVFLYAARTMGFAPSDCVVIEDSVAGTQAGVAAGMPVYSYAGDPMADREGWRRRAAWCSMTCASSPICSISPLGSICYRSGAAIVSRKFRRAERWTRAQRFDGFTTRSSSCQTPQILAWPSCWLIAASRRSRHRVPVLPDPRPAGWRRRLRGGDRPLQGDGCRDRSARFGRFGNGQG